jgi:hypothetical protein
MPKINHGNHFRE